MSINGIASLIYAVDDLETCTRYFDDFGLILEAAEPGRSLFRLEEGSTVELRASDDPSLPSAWYEGNGLRELVWGVRSAEALEALVTGLESDRDVRRDADGVAHFLAPGGLPMGLKVHASRPVTNAPDAVNAIGHVQRLNQLRKWFVRARPKTINHVGIYSAEYVALHDFMIERLGFKYSDHALGRALMSRGGSCNEHHSIFIINAQKAGFHHAAFGVEDIDEIMAGANEMARRGWNHHPGRLGRHRIASALYWYQRSPCGGEAEYSADSDCLDDNWIPRVWKPAFGLSTWTVDHTPQTLARPDWEEGCRLDPDGASIEPFRNKPAVSG